MNTAAIAHIHIKKVNAAVVTDAEDFLAAEEPLEIKLIHGPSHNRQQQSLTVTMRTPGHDEELATGFLFTEGIIRSVADITNIRQISGTLPGSNVIQVTLREQVNPELKTTQRNFLATSSCVMCGKAGIDAILTGVKKKEAASPFLFPAALLHRIPGTLQAAQQIFENTGGLHAAALFNTDGTLLLMREDIGRHNAVDKIIGASLDTGVTVLSRCLLLLSGRAGFELIQKAAMTGIPIIAAVGAPSSMAVKMAQEWDITLIGFLREQRFNIYSGAERITF